MADRIDLEARLRDLAPHLALPTTPQLAAAVGRQLRQAPTRQTPLGRLRNALRMLARPSSARRIAFAVAAVVAIALVALTIPPVREGIARFLKLQGVTIERRQHLPTPSPRASGGSIGDRLSLGRAVTLAEARSSADFPVRVPPDTLPGPLGVFLRVPPRGGEVSFVYAPGPDLPDPTGTGAGLLVSEFRGDLQPEFFGKLAPEGTTVKEVTVEGVTGYWLSGAPHQFFVRADGNVQTMNLRLATNTLLWQKGNVTYRVEAKVGRERALAIAAGLR